ncbi:MAG: hypothetical protein WCX95_00140 [Candidatus Gracilibacteria bacterium]
MGEQGKLELGGVESKRSKAELCSSSRENRAQQADRAASEIARKRESSCQNEVMLGVKRDLLKMKDLTGKKLLTKETSLSEIKITARAGDTVGALVLAVDSLAKERAKKEYKAAIELARKLNPNRDLTNIPDVPPEVSIGWRSTVTYTRADLFHTDLFSCKLVEAAFLHEGDVVSFDEGNQVVVTLKNPKSIKAASAYVEKLSEENKKLEEKFTETQTFLASTYGVDLTKDLPERSTDSLKALRSIAKVLPLLEKALGTMRDKDPQTLRKILEIRLTPTNAPKKEDVISLGYGNLNAEKIGKYLKLEAERAR